MIMIIILAQQQVTAAVAQTAAETSWSEVVVGIGIAFLALDRAIVWIKDAGLFKTNNGGRHASELHELKIARIVAKENEPMMLAIAQQTAIMERLCTIVNERLPNANANPS